MGADDILSQRGHSELPDTVADLIDDVSHIASLFTHLRHVILIECADAGLARLIARELPASCPHSTD